MHRLHQKPAPILTALALTLCYTLGAASGQPAVAQDDKTDKVVNARLQYVANIYRLGTGDVLSMSVLPQIEYSAPEIYVRSDGLAAFPGAGEIYVAGRTVEEVRQEVADRLGKWIKNGNVVIAIKNPRPVTVYLSGAVQKPGSFQLISTIANNPITITSDSPVLRLDMLLSNVLANAGGLSLNADLGHVQVRRAATGTVETVNLWRFLKDGAADQDLWINTGDSIHVPELESSMAMSDADYQTLLRSTLAPKSIPIRVIGEVATPDMIQLDGQSPFLSSALAKTGGYAPQANRNVVAVRRFLANNEFTTLFIDPNKTDFVLRPNDVIYVGENKLYKAGRFMAQATLVLSPFQSLFPAQWDPKLGIHVT